MFWRKSNKKGQVVGSEIAPDEIFLDSSNLPQFNVHQFEGRLERPISTRTFFLVGLFFFIIVLLFVTKLWNLQITRAEEFAYLSDNNNLRHSLIVASRGVVYDRNGVPLIQNEVSEEHSDFATRKYSDLSGLSHLLGYVSYPSKDSSGFYYNQDFIGKDGIEKAYNDELSGKNGVKIVEVNALGKVESANLILLPEDGKSLTLSIDSRVQNKLYELISGLSAQIGFEGGAGALMDIKNGEILAITSFPEYSSQVLSDGSDRSAIASYLEGKGKPFLDRAISGLYTPGSIVKPFLAIGALEENVITPEKEILSTGSISIPNPYDPKKKTIFNDWRPQGYVDMRHAIAVSSDVYFYEIGGGFESQKGLGIEKIEKYLRLFGFGEETTGSFFNGPAGIISSPVWKSENFPKDPWRIGDTYNSSIGQYGTQVTPLQSLRAVAAVANGGTLLDPSITLGGEVVSKVLGLAPENVKVAQEGMRLSVQSGTASGLNVPQVKIAAKTGTAELGSKKQFVNSWVTGFFPYDHPRYAFTVVMEKGPHDNTIGALYVMRQLIEWMTENASSYLNE